MKYMTGLCSNISRHCSSLSRSACSARLLLGNIVAGHNNGCRSPAPVPLQRPAAAHEDRCAIPFIIDKLAFPPACAKQLGLDLVERQRSDGLPEFRTEPAHRFRAVPAVQFLGAATPIGDYIIVEAAGDDRIMRQIEKVGLLAQRRFAPTVFAARERLSARLPRR